MSTFASLPHKFCMQVRYIWEDTIGVYTKPRRLGPVDRALWKAGDQPLANLIWRRLYAELEREVGLSPLKNDDEDRLDLFTDFIVRSSLNEALRAIEITFREISSWHPPVDYWMESVLENAKLKPEAAIDKLNARFRENDLDYEFRDTRVVTI